MPHQQYKSDDVRFDLFEIKTPPKNTNEFNSTKDDRNCIQSNN